MYTPTRRPAKKPPIDKEITSWPKGYMSPGRFGVVPEDALGDMTNADMGASSLPYPRKSLTPYGKPFLGTCIGIEEFKKTLDTGVQEHWEISLQVVPKNEVKTLSIMGGPTGGNFTLTFDGQTTGNIAYNASAATVQTALEALSNIAPGDVVCTGGSLPGTSVVLTFGGVYAYTDVPAMTANSAGLTGGSTPTASVPETMKGGNVARLHIRKDGGAWTEITGTYSYDKTKWANLCQSNGRVYITNGSDHLSYYDIVSGSIVSYTQIAKPNTPTVAQTGLTGTNYTYYYVITAFNESGETDASAEGHVQVSALRESWDGTSQYISVSWTGVSGAEGYNIYVGTSITDVRFLTAVTGGTTYKDTGTSIAAITKTPPLTNGTDGPVLTYLVNIVGQLYGWGDINNPSYVWYDGGGAGVETSGNFTISGGGGYIAIDDGGPSIPMAVLSYRTGKGDPAPTVICNGTGGSGGVRHISFTPQTIGDLSALMPSIDEANGDVGTVSPRGCVAAENSVHFPTGINFSFEGSAPNIPNILSPNSSSDFIREDVENLTLSAMTGCVGKYYRGRIYWALPVISETNNQIWVLDLTTNPARWIMPWTIAAQHMWLYQDNAGDTHFCMLVDGEVLEFSDIAHTSDNGTPFRVRIASGPLRWDEAGIAMGYIQKHRFKVLNPRGEISFNVTGTDQDQGFEDFPGSFTNVIPQPNTGWGEFVWGENQFSEDPNITGSQEHPSQTVGIDIKAKCSELKWEVVSSTAGCDYAVGATHTQGIVIPKLFAGD